MTSQAHTTSSNSLNFCYKIAVVGLLKAGKSTFLNAIVNPPATSTLIRTNPKLT
jgi:ribosome biogenesis GTPase A